MMKGGSGHQMQEMMLKTMMPNCIQMMLPAIDADAWRSMISNENAEDRHSPIRSMEC